MESSSSTDDVVNPNVTCTSLSHDVAASDLLQRHMTVGDAFVVLVLVLIDVTTVLGNVLVCVTITLVRRLHSVTNYLVCSLAFCDLLLGCLVLPFSILNTVAPDSWPFGAVFCNFYVSNDVALCTVSILTLLVIGIDRYVAVVSPFLYARLTADRRLCAALQIVAGVWVFSFAMAYIPIHLGWNTDDGAIQNQRPYQSRDRIHDDESVAMVGSLPQPTRCEFENTSVYYVLFIAVGTYFCPLVILCAVYVRVFAIARRHVARIRKLTSSVTTPPVHHYSASATAARTGNGAAMASEARCLVVGDPAGSSSSSSSSMASETKATVTLGSVVLAFAVCWVPYFVLFAAKPFVVGGVNPTLDLFTLWLGYANSMLNPFLYAFYGSEFRHGFQLVLCRWRRRESGGGSGGFRDRYPEVYYL